MKFVCAEWFKAGRSLAQVLRAKAPTSLAMARNAQVTRILRVLNFLELNPQGLPARELRAKLESHGIVTSRETIYKDLNALVECGIPVINEGRGETAVWKLESLVRLSKDVTFSYNEIIALYLARESLKSLEHSPLYDSIVSFFNKLEKLMGAKCHEAVQELSKTMSVRVVPSWASTSSREILDTVQSACAEGQILEIDYQSTSGTNAGRITTRKLGCHHLYFADSGSYLVAVDQADGVIKTFAIPRIKRAVMTEQPFEGAHFNVDEFFRSSVGVLSTGTVEDVVINIEEPMATYISERRLHPSQRTVRKEDGVQLTMHVKINDEFVRWVLGLGACAVVVKPNSLKRMILNELEDALKSYIGSKTKV